MVDYLNEIQCVSSNPITNPMFLLFGSLSLLFCKLLRIPLRFAYDAKFFSQGVNKVQTFVLFEFSLIALYYLEGVFLIVKTYGSKDRL